MKENIVYINGEFLREDEARISPFNRGLLYGDGLFETMRSYSGEVFALDEHFARLKKSAEFLSIHIPFGAAEVEGILRELLSLNSLLDIDGRIRLNLVRGEGRGGLIPDEDAGSEIIITAERVPDGIDRLRDEGIRVNLIKGIRVDSSSPLAGHKTLNYVPGILGLTEVRKRGGDEGIFLNNEGNVSEGTTSNIFMVKDGALVTPPVSAGILPGITREFVMKVALRDGIAVVERDIKVDELMDSDEIFITSSVREVVPVVEFNCKSFAAGAVTRCLQEKYRRYVMETLRLP